MPKKTKPKTPEGSTHAVEVRRSLVSNDPRPTAVPADFATITVVQDFVVHTLYQTLLPIGVETTPPTELEAVLVGRFSYGPTTFQALIALFIRQYVLMRSAQGKAQESLQWLEEEIRKHQPAPPSGSNAQ
jgi:hypothetical protein